MSWNNVENKCKEMYQIQLANGVRQPDRRFVIQAIAEEFPQYPRLRIAATVDRCLAMEEQPIETRRFLGFMQSFLR
ncbi:hypothetical protein [Flavobacterium sp. XGLA_31]|uniref:hypothetical protein n=1 Tax=Flavobacterium sp. XGLA_31 TaxID=3447666 RepID=UPI003F37A702